jgi:hypothetical protein
MSGLARGTAGQTPSMTFESTTRVEDSPAMYRIQYSATARQCCFSETVVQCCRTVRLDSTVLRSMVSSARLGVS